MAIPLNGFAPHFVPDPYTPDERHLLEPFFTNLDKPVCGITLLSPELVGALCSRASRATGDLRKVFLKDFAWPFYYPERGSKETDEDWTKKLRYGAAFAQLVDFLRRYPPEELFANPVARKFYLTWLAEYGDDSIAQMAGTHLVFSGLSQVAIKHFEDQRIGLAPIEKSTRYVNYGEKVGGRYLYYTDPTLADFGLREEYEAAMDHCFETYNHLIPKMIAWLTEKFPKEKASVVEKKAFDTLRGLLPTSTLSQVAFFGNGQAFEHMINRSATHPLGEIRWAANTALHELEKVTPSFLRRLTDPEKQDVVNGYQEYLVGKGHRVRDLAPRCNLD